MLLVCCVFLLTTQSNANPPEASQFYQPAEFSTQTAVWLAWPTEENQASTSLVPFEVALAKAIAASSPVNILVNSADQQKDAEQACAAEGIPLNRLSFYLVPHDDVWIRDYGPIFTVNTEGETEIAGFKFDVWGWESPESDNSKRGQKVAPKVATALDVRFRHANVISEGGNRSFNGDGIMLATWAVEHQRNPTLTKRQLEGVFKSTLGARKIIWLQSGLYSDSLPFEGLIYGPSGNKDTYALGTGGHSDEYARFVSKDTVLLAEVPKEEKATPSGKIDTARLAKNIQILQQAQTLDGNHLRIVRIPTAPTLYSTIRPSDPMYDILADFHYKDGSLFPRGRPVQVSLATSYVNFLITNKSIIVPAYWHEGMPETIKERDHKAHEVLHNLFPNRELIALNPTVINMGGGGIHCITQQQPAVLL